MVYEVPESKRSLKQNQFEFIIPGDKKTYTVRRPMFLTAGEIELVADKGSSQVSFVDVVDLFCQDSGAKESVRTLDMDQLTGLMKAWQGKDEEGDLSLGESSASSTS